jgi:hypothetical protein
MSERSLKNRSNGKLLELQRLCERVGVSNWRMKFQSTLPARRPGDNQIDMFIVRDGDKPETVITVGTGHGDVKAQQFFDKLFQSIVPALAGSLLLLDLYDTIVKLQADWWDLDLRAELDTKIKVIRDSVDRADKGLAPVKS